MIKKNSMQLIVVFLFLYLFWIGTIFFFSSQTASEQSITSQLEHLFNEKKLMKVFKPLEFTYGDRLITYHKPYKMLEFFIRKLTHIMVYLILTLFGLIWWNFVFINRIYTYLIAISLSLIYAGIDEWHQTFVMGRTGTYLDVGVDAIGVLLALGLFMFYQFREKNKE